MGQGANNGAGQAAGNNQFVKFSRGAAQRIAKVVRTVEGGDRGQPGVTFDHPTFGSPLRLATFTGAWETGTYKTVTLVGGTSTASVYNWCNRSSGDTANTTNTRYVIYGRAHGTNSVVEIQVNLTGTNGTCVMTLAGVDLTAFPGYSAGAIQLLGHSAADVTTNNTACAALQWYSVTTCATS